MGGAQEELVRFPSGRGANGWRSPDAGSPGGSGELLGVHQTPSWLPEGAGRVLLIDATRWKTPGGTGDDVRLHQSYELRAGRMEQVQVTDRHQAESLGPFPLAGEEICGRDRCGLSGGGSSVEMTQQQQALLLQRTTASHLHLEDEQGQTIELERARQASGQQQSERTRGLCALAQQCGAVVPDRVVAARARSPSGGPNLDERPGAVGRGRSGEVSEGEESREEQEEEQDLGPE